MGAPRGRQGQLGRSILSSAALGNPPLADSRRPVRARPCPRVPSSENTDGVRQGPSVSPRLSEEKTQLPPLPGGNCSQQTSKGPKLWPRACLSRTDKQWLALLRLQGQGRAKGFLQSQQEIAFLGALCAAIPPVPASEDSDPHPPRRHGPSGRVWLRARCSAAAWHGGPLPGTRRPVSPVRSLEPDRARGPLPRPLHSPGSSSSWTWPQAPHRAPARPPRRPSPGQRG